MAVSFDASGPGSVLRARESSASPLSRSFVSVRLWLSKPFWDPILVGIGEFTTHFRTYFSGWIESDVHWGYDLAHGNFSSEWSALRRNAK